MPMTPLLDADVALMAGPDPLFVDETHAAFRLR